MNTKQEKYIKLLNNEIMNAIMKYNQQAAEDGNPIGLQTYILLIDIACDFASELKISKKDQLDSFNHFIKQNADKKKSLDIETNKKLSKSFNKNNEEVSASMDDDFEEIHDEEIINLFSSEFETKKDCN